MQSRRQRICGLWAAALTTCAIGLVLATAASADAQAGSAPRVDRQAWADTGALPIVASGGGEAYVAATGGDEQARAFVHIQLDTADGQGRQPAVLQLVEATDSLLADQAGISACLLTAPFPGTGQISASEVPAPDCTIRVDGTRDETGRWSFELGVFVQKWASGANNGLALFPDLPVGTGSFRVGFDTTKTTLAVTRASQPRPASSPSATSTAPAVEEPAKVSAQQPPSPVASLPVTGVENRREESTPVVAPAPTEPAPAATVSAGATKAATSPPAAAVLALVLLVVLAGATARREAVAAVGASSDSRPAQRANAPRSPSQLPLRAMLLIGILTLPMFASDPTTFKLGILIITVVAAIGLHILVNWSGEFSLAHAGFIGLPALVTARISADAGLSPIYVLPIAVLVGAALGGVVALPAMRARGLQVALVTLAAGVAIDRFFFTKSWLVGASGVASVPTPTLGPLTLGSSRSLYPVLAAFAALSAAVATMLYKSKLARSFLWMKENPQAASAFGVPVRRYRIVAFAVAGAYAGLAGGLSVMWIQRVSPTSFPLAESINYLLFAVLAGPGFIWGVVLAAGLFEAGRLFISSAGWIFVYGGPLGLVVNVVRYPQGVNGMIRSFSHRMRGVVAMSGRAGDRTLASTSTDGHGMQRLVSGAVRYGRDLLPVFGVACIAVGFTCIGLAWYHAGNTDQLWIQNQELISGGVGGLALVLTGLGLLIRDRLRRNNEVLVYEITSALAELTIKSGAVELSEQRVAAVTLGATSPGTSAKAGA